MSDVYIYSFDSQCFIRIQVYVILESGVIQKQKIVHFKKYLGHSSEFRI